MSLVLTHSLTLVFLGFTWFLYYPKYRINHLNTKLFCLISHVTNHTNLKCLSSFFLETSNFLYWIHLVWICNTTHQIHYSNCIYKLLFWTFYFLAAHISKQTWKPTKFSFHLNTTILMQPTYYPFLHNWLKVSLLGIFSPSISHLSSFKILIRPDIH